MISFKTLMIALRPFRVRAALFVSIYHGHGLLLPSTSEALVRPFVGSESQPVYKFVTARSAFASFLTAISISTGV